MSLKTLSNNTKVKMMNSLVYLKMELNASLIKKKLEKYVRV